MGGTGWSADFPDPSNFFEPTLSSKAIADEGSQNLAFFSSAELDEVLARAHGEPDPALRMAGYARAEAIIREEAPWIPMYSSRTFEVWQPYLRGYLPHAVLEQPFAEVWIDRGAASGAGPLAGLGGLRR
jgi:ABC-type oligopeptide transport system substrate-binding subunit